MKETLIELGSIDAAGVTKYGTIVADPPWPYGGAGVQLRASLSHRPNRDAGLGKHGADSLTRYGSMSIEELCALAPQAEDKAHLYLWTTNSFMVEAHEIARAWGFDPKTILTWGKVQPDGRPSMKTGFYFRGATEHVLFATRGNLRLATNEAQPTLWLWPRLAHSVKPDAFYDLVEKCSPGPYLEMFSRRARFGWDTWGDQALHGTSLVTSNAAA